MKSSSGLPHFFIDGIKYFCHHLTSNTNSVFILRCGILARRTSINDPDSLNKKTFFSEERMGQDSSNSN